MNTRTKTLNEPRPIPISTKRPEQTDLNNTPLKLCSKSSQYQYEIRPDGTVVKLRCPICYSDKFKSMLGYLNHCRIHCKVIFSSPEDRQTRGGVPVDIDEVPHEIFMAKHPSLVKQEHDLAIIRSEVSNNSYDENRLPNINECNIDYAFLNVVNNNTILTKEVTDHSMPESFFTSDSKTDQCSSWNLNRFYVQKSIIIGNEASCLIPQSTIKESLNQVATHKWKFYVRPGNYYSLKNRDLSIEEMHSDLNKLVESIEINLHPNYKPSQVTLFGPTFELELAGWGEFPIRVVINFWDKKRNKPLEFIHQLRIYMACQQGKMTPGPERLYSIDIDKETDFSLARPNYSLPPRIVLETSPVGSKISDKSQFEILKEYFDSVPFSSEDATDLKKNICNKYPNFSLSTGEIQNWLTNEHKAISSTRNDIRMLKYCRFCGLSHAPQELFETLQKNCSFKPKKLRFSTKNSSADLFEKYSNLPQRDLSCFNFPVSSWISFSPSQNPCLSYNFVLSVVNGNNLLQGSVSMISGSMIVFLKSLISLSVSKLKVESDKKIEIDCLTPWHIYTTIIEKESSFSFLTNSFLSI